MRIRAYKDSRGEASLFQRRALSGFALILLGLAGLACRYVYLQVDRHDEFALRSQQNRIKPRVIPPGRGLIYDRNGVLLADNVSAFRLEVIPDQVPNMSALLTQLGQSIPLSAEEIHNFQRQLKFSRRFDSVPLKMHLTEDEIDRFAVDRWRFPGVDVVPYQIRRYPLGDLFAHAVGYVARIDERDLSRLDPEAYKGTTHAGRLGVERSYESELHGKPGYDLVEVNAAGRVQRLLEHHPAIAGENLYLSVDARLQKAAVEAFDGRPGAAVAIDPRNGQVLALVSVPSYNTNLFVSGISTVDYRELITNPDKPMLNRAIRSVYPPGSTIKPLLGAAGLEYGLRTPADTVYSTGEFHIPGLARTYRDDRRYGFGRVNLVQAIESSVNTYFYKLALDMGIDKMGQFMAKFRFGSPTGIDLDGEARGVLPSRQWKWKRFHKGWYLGETVISGIGQGYWQVTPLQLANAFAIFADHGVPYPPKLLLATAEVGQPKVWVPHPASGPSVLEHPSTWAPINRGMELVIYGQGTGRGLGNGFPYRMAGKSGTTERYSRTTSAYDTVRHSKAYLAARHRAWFVAYTPSEAPRIVVAVILEAGAWGGSDAGPIVRKILNAWLADERSDAADQGGAAPAASSGDPASMASGATAR